MKIVKNDLFDYKNRYIWQIQDGFKFSLDSILLAEYTKVANNLNILDIQSTLDTVIKYRLMKGVSLKVVEEDDDMAVDNLQIPDFNKMMVVLKKCKLYRKA